MERRWSRLPQYTRDEYDFQVVAPQRGQHHIAEGKWYEIAEFRADDEQTERFRRNTGVVGGRVQRMANLAWILYRTGLLYARTDEAGSVPT
jgi:hypothetical protein